jgi:uncharacterized membrane protein YgaE (UPF0421/DUF939 family)
VVIRFTFLIFLEKQIGSTCSDSSSQTDFVGMYSSRVFNVYLIFVESAQERKRKRLNEEMEDIRSNMEIFGTDDQGSRRIMLLVHSIDREISVDVNTGKLMFGRRF